MDGSRSVSLLFVGIFAGILVVVAELISRPPANSASFSIILIQLTLLVAACVGAWKLRGGITSAPADATRVWEERPVAKHRQTRAENASTDVYCMYCGYVLPEDAAYCRRCGRPQRHNK
jgi:ribosomal protein L40E